MTTRNEISGWFDEGKAKGATHMIVVCDTYDYEDFPVYVMPGEDVEAAVKRRQGPNMQKVMEVYNLGMDAAEQLEQPRAWNLQGGHMTDQAHREMLVEAMARALCQYTDDAASDWTNAASDALNALTTGPVFEAMVELAITVAQQRSSSFIQRDWMTAALRAALGATGMGDR